MELFGTTAVAPVPIQTTAPTCRLARPVNDEPCWLLSRQPNISFGVAILHRRNNRHVPALPDFGKKQVLRIDPG
jgi:hypothetical protein